VGLPAPQQVLRAFVDQHRDRLGVESICRVLQIAPSGYRRHAAQQRNPELRCCRARRDEALSLEIQRVWDANM
jgi:putative transposase